MTLKALKIGSNTGIQFFHFFFFWAFNWCYSISKYRRMCQTN